LEERTAALFTTFRLTRREFLQEGKGAVEDDVLPVDRVVGDGEDFCDVAGERIASRRLESEVEGAPVPSLLLI
jgi:hypothetical protein